MSSPTKPSGFGVLVEPTTLRMERVLPGPVERVWAYITEETLRRQWLADGPMELQAGGSLELVWRNDELTVPPGHRPEGAAAEHRMVSRVLELEPIRKLTIAWGEGSVTFELHPQGDMVHLAVVHRGVSDRSTLLSVGPGWHAHLDILENVLGGVNPRPFWDEVARLKTEYEERLRV